MSNQNSAKGNPASRRMSNPRRKERRAKCWERGEKRKEARRQAQEAAHKENLQAIAAGGMTPWQASRHNRSIARAAKGLAAVGGKS